jgi:hypothetical protein
MAMQNRTVPGNIIMATISLLLWSMVSCTTSPTVVIHQSDPLSVVLRELPGGYPSIMPVQHPYTISPETAFDILDSLTYDAGALLPFSKSQPRKVFTKTQAEQLAPPLSKALSLAPPEQVTSFTIADVDKPDRRTMGFVFVVNDELHLIIQDLRRPRYEGEQTSYQHPLSNGKLRPNGRQRLYARHGDGKGEMPNWIISPLR